MALRGQLKNQNVATVHQTTWSSIEQNMSQISKDGRSQTRWSITDFEDVSKKKWYCWKRNDLSRRKNVILQNILIYKHTNISSGLTKWLLNIAILAESVITIFEKEPRYYYTPILVNMYGQNYQIWGSTPYRKLDFKDLIQFEVGFNF